MLITHASYKCKIVLFILVDFFAVKFSVFAVPYKSFFNANVSPELTCSMRSSLLYWYGVAA